MNDFDGSNQPPLAEALRDDHADLVNRRDDLLAAADRAPVSIDDEDANRKMADFVKQIQAAIKNADAKRVDAKEPYLKAGREVDGFFKAITDPLDKVKRLMESRMTIWQRKVADAERRRREEEATRQREEALLLARAAAEHAEWMKSQTDLDAAVAAEAAAKQAAANVAVAQRAAEAKAAELSRSRGDFGAVASLHTFWDFKDLKRDLLNLEALRFQLPLDALDKAVRAYIKAGGRELRGVTIFENSQTKVR